jgi:outer membrane protein with beta-barrel domain
MLVRASVTGVCVLGLFATPALAQNKPSAGIEGGATLSWLSPELPEQPLGRTVGIMAGVYGAVPISKTIGLRVEGLYVQKYSRLGTTDLKLDYFEIPILAILPLLKGIYMTEGIGVAFPIAAKLRPSDGAEQDIKNQTTNPDIGLIIGGGFPVRTLGIEVRYDGGFKRVNSSPTAAVQRNRSWALLLRWRL